jgi:hypothetical protein
MPFYVAYYFPYLRQRDPQPLPDQGIRPPVHRLVFDVAVLIIKESVEHPLEGNPKNRIFIDGLVPIIVDEGGKDLVVCLERSQPRWS